MLEAEGERLLDWPQAQTLEAGMKQRFVDSNSKVTQ
jgi:hypothetical protein